MSNQNLGFWRNRNRLTSLVVGVLFLIPVGTASAEYKPRNRKAASGYSRGGGSRGCSSNSIPLTLLAPKTFVGKTASVRPMLAWYMSSSQNVRFRLFEFESAKKAKQIGEFKEISTIVGINKLKLPKEYPELTVGKTYLWQIAIDCRIGTIIQRAEFTVINPPSLTKKKFSTVLESVNYHTGKELWYEALEEALKTVDNGKLGQAGSKLVRELANSEMLMDNTKIIEKRVEHLQKISRVDL